MALHCPRSLLRGLVAGLLLSSVAAPQAWTAERLRVTPDGRWLERSGGTPFFYLGDTAWTLLQDLDPEEGVASHFHTTDNTGFQTYTPPTVGRGSDWILILESEASGFQLLGPR